MAVVVLPAAPPFRNCSRRIVAYATSGVGRHSPLKASSTGRIDIGPSTTVGPARGPARSSNPQAKPGRPWTLPFGKAREDAPEATLWRASCAATAEPEPPGPGSIGFPKGPRQECLVAATTHQRNHDRYACSD